MRAACVWLPHFLVYARSREDAPSHESLSVFIVERGPDVEAQHV